MLETSECILIHNTNNRSYTDCMEWTLLRFMQLMLYDENYLIDNQLTKNVPYNFITFCLNINKTILNYIKNYNIIYVETEHYETINGITERTEWVKLLSDHDNLFDYYRNDKAELFTNVHNILMFCKHFFNIENISNNNTQQTNLNIIALYFSQITKKNILLKIIETKTNKINNRMKDLCQLLSKQDEKLTDRNIQNNFFSAINKKIHIEITINEEKYLWTLMEYYLDDKYTEFENKFITGHSVINKI